MCTPASSQPTITLTSEPLADGKPWEITYPFGTAVVRVLRTYDDVFRLTRRSLARGKWQTRGSFYRESERHR